MDSLYSDDQLDILTNHIIASIFNRSEYSTISTIGYFPAEIVEFMTDDLIMNAITIKNVTKKFFNKINE